MATSGCHGGNGRRGQQHSRGGFWSLKKGNGDIWVILSLFNIAQKKLGYMVTILPSMGLDSFQ